MQTTQQQTLPEAIPLGVTLTYRKHTTVTAFGRERDKDGVVVYYWVVTGSGKTEKRFKAYPNELTQ